MFQFIPDSPELPIKLLRSQSEGRLVLFCGAGISMYTGLPAFPGLCDEVTQALAHNKNDIEQQSLKDQNYDRYLGLVEERTVKGAVRREVIKRLLSPFSGTLDLHQAILRLSKLKAGGIRMITTNFDHRFVEAGLAVKDINAAPRLPVPRAHAWSSVVFLHGIIDESQDPNGEHLILTTSDFGRAYLTDGWASRFLTELFREFDVLFLGYSAKDPVVAYLISALAAHRAHGNHFRDAYALAGFSAARNNADQQRKDWSSRGIIPLLYDDKDHHKILAQTIMEWSKMRDSEKAYKRSVIESASAQIPKGEDWYSRRLCWALLDSDGEGAKVFSELDPPAPLEWWFEVFDRIELELDPPMIGTGKLSGFPLSVHGSRPLSLTVCGQTATELLLHPITYFLSGWLAKSIGKRELLTWILRRGPILHDQFKDAVRAQLRNPTLDLAPGLRRAWELLTSDGVDFRTEGSWTFSEPVVSSSKRYPLELTKHELLLLLCPVVHMKPLSATWPSWFGEDSVQHFADVQVKLRSSDTISLQQIISKSLLSACGFDFTFLLLKTIELLVLVNCVFVDYDSTSISLVSIDEHEQDKFADDWTLLIRLCRDAMKQLVDEDLEIANVLLTYWLSLKYNVFKRLALHSLTDSTDLDAEIGFRMLLKNGGIALWSSDLRREVCRFLRIAYTRLSEQSRQQLELDVIAGPSLEFLAFDGSEPEKMEKHRKWLIWLMLDRISISGVALSAQGAQIHSEIQTELKLVRDSKHREEFSRWSSGTSWSDKGLDDDDDLEEQRRWNDRQAQLRNIDPEQMIEEIDFSAPASDNDLGFLSTERPDALLQAIQLLDKDELKLRWQPIFSALTNNTFGSPQSIWNGFAPLLKEIAEEDIADEVHIVSRWLEKYAKVLDLKDLDLFVQIAEQLCDENLFSNTPDVDSGTLGRAINSTVGQFALAILSALRVASVGATGGSGIPVQLFGLIDGVANFAGVNGLLVKCIFASELVRFYFLDPDWTRSNLLSDMDWSDEKTSASLWSGYLWFPRYFDSLVREYKTSLLQTLDHWDAFKTYCDRQFVAEYISLLTFVLLDYFPEFQTAELQHLAGKLNAEKLISVANSIQEKLEQIPNADERGKVWTTEISPLLSIIWPKGLDAQNVETSVALLRVAILCGTELPAAADFVAQFLVATSHELYWLDTIPLLNFQSAQAKSLIKLMHGQICGPLMDYHRKKLKVVLDYVEALDSAVAKSNEFQSLTALTQSI